MPALSIVVPTYNERENLRPFLDSLDAVGIDYEVVIVDDDSSDSTSALARSLAQQNPKVRLLHRIGRLSSATVESVLSTSASYVAVMDADMQHDERILPQMLEKLQLEALDIVIGTRTAEGAAWEHSHVGAWRLANLAAA